MIDEREFITTDRLALLYDGGKYTILDPRRGDRNGNSAVICAHGFVDGQSVYVFTQDRQVNNGAMDSYTAGKISRLYHLAAKTGAPVVGIYDSDGVVFDGTAESLSAYGRLIAESAKLSGVVPQISVIAGVCAGSAALLAAQADFVLSAADSELYLTPPYGTDAAKPETAAKAGVVAIVEPDAESVIQKCKELLCKLPANNLTEVPLCEYTNPQAFCSKEDILTGLADQGSILKVYDAFGQSAETAFATVRGITVGIVTTARSDDPLTADDAVKIARFVRTCDAFSIPLLTFVDTVGFAADNEAAANGSLRALSRLCGAYAEATTVKIAVITGEACGPAFTALAGRGAGSDYVFAWNGAAIAPLRPEAAVEFLWHDKLKGAADANAKRTELAKEYKETLASPEKAAELAVIDDILDPKDTRLAIMETLDMLESKRVQIPQKKHSNIPF